MPRILIVDDEPIVRQLLEETLDDGSNQLLLAATAGEALELATGGGGFDVALIDKNLPDLSGLELIRKLKDLIPEGETILITAYASLDSAIDAVGAGAGAYLIKPFKDIEAVRAKVREALTRHHELVGKKIVLQELLSGDDLPRFSFEGAPDAILLYDRVTGELIDANPAAARLYGYSVGEMLKLTIDRLGAGPRAPGRDAVMRFDLRADGSERLVEATGASLRLGAREVGVEIVRDATPEVLDLKDLVTELEPALRRAAERAIEVAVVSTSGPCPAVGSRSHLSRLLLHLVAYAGGRVTVAAEARESEEIPARVTVTAASGLDGARALALAHPLARRAGGEARHGASAGKTVFQVLLPSE